MQIAHTPNAAPLMLNTLADQLLAQGVALATAGKSAAAVSDSIGEGLDEASDFLIDAAGKLCALIGPAKLLDNGEGRAIDKAIQPLVPAEGFHGRNVLIRELGNAIGVRLPEAGPPECLPMPTVDRAVRIMERASLLWAMAESAVDDLLDADPDLDNIDAVARHHVAVAVRLLNESLPSLRASLLAHWAVRRAGSVGREGLPLLDSAA